MKKAGIIILIAGILLTVFTAGKIFTKEKIVDLGSVEISSEKPHSYSWSPMIGIGVIAVGVIVLLKVKKM